MFLGRYEHSIDEKGRLTVPARFREPLMQGAYITLGFDQNLMVLTPEIFKLISENVRQMSITDPETRLLKRLIFSHAEWVEVDRVGRILIPQWLRNAAQIDGNVVVVGNDTYFEIWSPNLWENQTEQLQDSEANARRFATLNLPL